MNRCPILLLLVAMPFVLTFAETQDSIEVAQRLAQAPLMRVLIQKGFFFAESNGADQSGYQYSFAVGSAPKLWWHSSIHLWLTYDEYHYYRGWLTMDRKDEYLLGIYPTLRLFSCLLLGYGCSFGNRSREQWDPGSPVSSYVQSKGWSSKWSYILGIDVNIYVVYNFYLAVGILRKEPIGVYSLGIAKTL